MIDTSSQTRSDYTPLISIWLSRLQGCLALLENDPGNDMAERWRIQIKVLQYMVARYGSNPAVRSVHVSESGFCWIEPFRQQSVPNRTGTRTRNEFREILDRIAAAKAS